MAYLILDPVGQSTGAATSGYPNGWVNAALTVTTTTLRYHDEHGFGFVREIEVDEPGRRRTTVLVPEPVDDSPTERVDVESAPVKVRFNSESNDAASIKARD